jgi:copper homeostasis protein
MADTLLLEVIVQSIEDARAAAEGGADRLELVRDISLDGLTPPVALVRAIAAETPLPLRVMVRENAGYGTDSSELVRLCRAAAMFADLGVDGLVAGFARDGVLLLNDLREVLQAAPGTPATFHRAFDSLDDPLRAIDLLSEIPQVDRVLTDGMPAHKGPAYEDGMPAHKGPAYNRRRPGLYAPAAYDRRGPGLYAPAADRCARLREYATRAGPRLTIIAGGGVDETLLEAIARTGCVREVHVGRAAREGGRESPVTAARVRRLRAMLNGLPELPESPESRSLKL